MGQNKLVSLFFKFSYGGLVSAGISFFSTPVITALIIPDEFGRASMFILAFGFLLQLVMLGTDQSFVRFFYQDRYKNKENELLVNSLAMPVIVSLSFIAVILLYRSKLSFLLVNKVDYKVSYLLALTLVFGLIERFSTLSIRMKQKGVLFSNLKILQSLINVVVIICYAQFVEKSFFAILYGTLVSLLVTAFLGIYFDKTIWSKGFTINKSSIKEIIKYGLPFIPTFLISWVFEAIDKMALRYFSTFEEIGLYTAASKIVAILTVIQIAFSNFWTPIAYEAFEKNSKESKLLFENMFKGLSAVFFITAILIIAFKDFIILLFAKDYVAANTIVPFLVLMPIMYALSEITVCGINFKQKTYWHLLIAFISAIVNILGVYFLVATYGARGAAISTGLAYIAFFYARTIISNRYFPLNFQLVKTSISISIIVVTAYVSTFNEHKLQCFLINTIALILVLLIYRKELYMLFRRIVKNK